jgi:SAM-dependent methyltransferase
MAVAFKWEESEMQELLESCGRDEASAVIERHFPRGARLLEAGCGAARWVRYLKDRGFEICGLEYAAETVAMVKGRWPDLDVIQGDCQCSPYPNDSFDGALSFGVVEHFPDGPQAPLKDLLRILKPGGRAYISVPCHNTVRRIKRALWWNEVRQAPGVFSRMLRKGVRKSMPRLDSRYRYPVYPAWGEFFEYRMSVADFRAEVERAGFEVLEHLPAGSMDGVFHELNPFKSLVRFEHWTFHPTRLGRALDRWLSRRPFTHPHLQAIVARKPLR